MPFMVLCPSKVPFGQHITIERGPISFQLDVRVWGVATVVGGAKGCLAADTLHGKKTYRHRAKESKPKFTAFRPSKIKQITKAAKQMRHCATMDA